MTFLENIPLAPYTTFKIGGPAAYLCEVESEDDIVEAVNFAHERRLPIIVLGGGSNILVSDLGYNGLVIVNRISGVMYKDRGDTVIVAAGAGEDWEKLVEDTVERGLYGIENLSAIPGKVGATPVQNIGAYGEEVSKAIISVRAFDIENMKYVEFGNSDCAFAYRDSRFKHEKGRYIISQVLYELQKKGKINIAYRDLAEYFSKQGITEPSLKEVRQAVISIRQNKLPDWTKWGTAGSFFKNPVISALQYKKLQILYPGLPGFPEPNGEVKVSLGWILDKVCEAKGLTIGNVGTYEKQALVFVAKPGATASEVIALANELMRRVKEKTGILIEAEVEWAVV